VPPECPGVEVNTPLLSHGHEIGVFSKSIRILGKRFSHYAMDTSSPFGPHFLKTFLSLSHEHGDGGFSTVSQKRKNAFSIHKGIKKAFCETTHIGIISIKG
jgi:hypothetical protein